MRWGVSNITDGSWRKSPALDSLGFFKSAIDIEPSGGHAHIARRRSPLILDCRSVIPSNAHSRAIDRSLDVAHAVLASMRGVRWGFHVAARPGIAGFARASAPARHPAALASLAFGEPASRLRGVARRHDERGATPRRLVRGRRSRAWPRWNGHVRHDERQA